MSEIRADGGPYSSRLGPSVANLSTTYKRPISFLWWMWSKANDDSLIHSWTSCNLRGAGGLSSISHTRKMLQALYMHAILSRMWVGMEDGSHWLRPLAKLSG